MLESMSMCSCRKKHNDNLRRLNFKFGLYLTKNTYVCSNISSYANFLLRGLICQSHYLFINVKLFTCSASRMINDEINICQFRWFSKFYASKTMATRLGFVFLTVLTVKSHYIFYEEVLCHLCIVLDMKNDSIDE
jgi:hypothetical protein